MIRGQSTAERLETPGSGKPSDREVPERAEGTRSPALQAAEAEPQPIPGHPTADHLQLLSTEHWSLLTTRSLAYNESFSRVGMFLSLLSGAVVGLALLAQVDHYRDTFMVAAILILCVVLFVGLVTIGRLATLNRDDLRCVMGMNRLRHAYLQVHPELEPYFVAGWHDDLRGLMQTMDMDMAPGRWRPRDAIHGFQTMPAMLVVIVAVVAGVLAALVAVWLGASRPLAVALATAVFLTTAVLLWWLTRRAFETFARTMPTRFPSAEDRNG